MLPAQVFSLSCRFEAPSLYSVVSIAFSTSRSADVVLPTASSWYPSPCHVHYICIANDSLDPGHYFIHLIGVNALGVNAQCTSEVDSFKYRIAGWRLLDSSTDYPPAQGRKDIIEMSFLQSR